MFLRFLGRVALCSTLVIITAQTAQAIETVKSKLLIEVVDRALASHPLLQLAEAKLDQAQADAKAQSQPLYNPQLALDYESNVDDLATIGISQTFDWADKQGAFEQIGQQNLLSAEARFIGVRQSIAAKFLKTINRYQWSKTAAELNSHQSDTLVEFVEIAKRRFTVGDINQIELDLALLAAGEIRMNSAKIQSEYYAAELALEAFQNFEQVPIPELKTDLIVEDSKSFEQILQSHPLLKQLKIASQAAQSKIKLASRQKSADPTFSLNAGKEGDESIVVVGFSMPLFVRNNYSAQVDSAIANSVAVEQQYLNGYRDVLVAVKSTRKRLSLTLNAYKSWQKNSQFGLQQRMLLLQKLWKSGDLATTSYLLQIQQTLDTQIAATQLKADVFEAWFDYLVASGQMDDWLDLAQIN